MAIKLGPLTIPWPGGDKGHDPYWDFFIHARPSDRNNLVVDAIRNAPEGAVNPVLGDIHTPEVMSGHVKELGRFFGADLMGIVGLGPHSAGPAESKPSGATSAQDYPFAIICALRADHDPREAAGVGGQVPVQNGLFVTFNLSSYIRELGYRATRGSADPERLAAAAGLGTLDSRGRLVTAQFGPHVHVADIILTDLPLAVDGQDATP